jgi:hypothetical protein
MPLKSKIAMIDLSNNEMSKEPILERMRRLYLGVGGSKPILFLTMWDQSQTPSVPGMPES